MKEIELKPCPLCGNDVEIETLVQIQFRTYARIVCRCGLSFEHTQREFTFEKQSDDFPNGSVLVGTGIFDDCGFVEAWNRRATDESAG